VAIDLELQASARCRQWLKREMAMRLLTTLGAALAVVAIAAAGAGAKTLRMADSTDIAAMDPHSMTESNTIGFLNHVYEGLVRYNDQLQVEPALAASWEVMEPTRVRFHLREGVKFHNGNPFTADDVVASIVRASHETSPVKSNLPGVKEAVKVDELTVDLILLGTDPIVLNYLTNIYILDKEWMEEHDALLPADVRNGKENYAVANSNGTGPFMLESRQPEATTVLVVNPNWWDTPKHNLTRIEFTPIASDATRIAALLSGELDFITPAPLQDIDRINRGTGVSVLEGPELRTIMLGFNYGAALHDSNITDRNPLADARVRRALNLAINMDLIHKKVMRGKSRNAGLLVAPPVPGYDAALDVRDPFDLGAAKALLAEAGYADGFEVGFDCPNDRYVNDEEICQAITAMWARLGVTARLNAQTKSKHFEKVLGGSSDIYMVGWATLPMLDSYSVLSALLHTKGDRMGAWNPGGYSNARIDALTDAVAVELDLAKRSAMMSEALGLAKDDVAIIALHQQPLAWAVRDGVHLTVTADNKPRLWYATISD
jgi:peptide/nickel transport system substrate-binding protein